MKRIAYLTNSGSSSGVGHRAVEIRKVLQELIIHEQFQLQDVQLHGEQTSVSSDDQVIKFRSWPGFFSSKSVNWIRLGKYWQSKIAPQQNLSLIHATNQTLSFLAGKEPSIVTIHDIIEVLEPQDRKAALINRYLYSGIPKATHLICVSQYTATTVQEYYGVPKERITVIPNGASSAFHPMENFRVSIAYQALLQELKLSPVQPIVLYVGSDHPRKNVVGAVRIFAKFREKYPQAIFLKVGEPGLAQGREALLKEIDGLNLREVVRFIGNVSIERLNELYNLADVLLYPSRFEGFGLPPLQAMAAGTPVITSNAASLPEVVGDGRQYGDQAAIMHDPEDIDGMTRSLTRLFENEQLRRDLRARGLERAKLFSWQTAAQKEMELYKRFV